MTAIPSPRWVALYLGDLLADYTGPLTDPHKRALAFAVETLQGDGMGHVADKLQSYLADGRMGLTRDDVLAEALRERDEAVAVAAQRARMCATLEADACEMDASYARLAMERDGKEYELQKALKRAAEAERNAAAQLAEMLRLQTERDLADAKLAATLDAPAPVGRDHPATSHEAAESVTHVAKMERLRIIASIIEDGPASASTIAKRLGLVPNQVSARCNGLRHGSGTEDGGWLEWRGIHPSLSDDEAHWVTETTPSGRKGNVLFLTNSARDQLIREHGSLEVAAKLFREGRTS